MEIIKFLTQVGLKDKEPIVYLGLLKTLGAQPASVIAKKINLNRTTTYKTLIELTKKGLVTKTTYRGITCFFAEEPSQKLKKMIQKKEKEAHFLSQILSSIIPELNNYDRKNIHDHKIRFYEGVEGVKSVYEEALIEGKTIYTFENPHDISSELHHYIYNQYIPLRVKNKIFTYVIAPEVEGNQSLKDLDKNSLRETKFAPDHLFLMDVEINIFGSKTAFFSYKKDEMFVVILESKSISDSMRSIFNLCWSISK